MDIAIIFLIKILVLFDLKTCIGKYKIFPCNVTLSRHRTNDNVRTLRPGDIDIIAALGDSITAAAGALATDITGVTHEFRGVGYMTGADGDWSDTPTIHNILQQFNPNLIVR